MTRLLPDEGSQRRTQPRETDQYCAGCGFAVYAESNAVFKSDGSILHPNCVAPADRPAAPKCAWCGGVPVGLFDSKVEVVPVNLCKPCSELDDAHEAATLYDRFVRSRCEAEKLREALRLILAGDINCEHDCVVSRGEDGEEVRDHDPLCPAFLAREALK